MAGLLAVYSASFAVGYHEYGDTNFFIVRQAVSAVVGLGALVVLHAARLPPPAHAQPCR